MVGAAATATFILGVLTVTVVLVFILRASWIILVEIPATRKRKHLSPFYSTKKQSQQSQQQTGQGQGQRSAAAVVPKKVPVLPIETLIVLGSGGHTAEMLTMTKHLDRTRTHTGTTPGAYNVTYVKAATDTTSRQRLVGVSNDDDNDDDTDSDMIVHDIPRSREVGQSYFSSIFTTCKAQWYCFWLVGRLAPDLILCNGPGTCLPICLAALFYNIILPFTYPNKSKKQREKIKIVFCESYCRVETLSLTGKLLYPIADLFVVHWPELHQKYPNTVLVSTFVVEDTHQHNTADAAAASASDNKKSS
jgi:beta-1,4-N-acetylglucosaminyltransferase